MALILGSFMCVTAAIILHQVVAQNSMEVFDAGRIKEYCHLEVFNVTCSSNHVIMMTSARFGRMRLGRCLRRGYGSVGCSSDVTSYFDSVCSGRQRCEVNIRDIPLQGFRPCSEELSNYFEGSYSCIPVAPRSRAHCSRHQHYAVNSASGFISNINPDPDPRDNGYQCPWRIRVLPGQRINLTLYDFSVFSGTSQSTSSSSGSVVHPQSVCKRYATVLEPTQRREHPICGGSHRIRSVYLSESHQIDIRFSDFTHNARDQTASSHFMMRYHAIGCPRVTSPRNSYVIYSDNGKSMTVTCNTTKEKWSLTCKDNEWVGTIANCTALDSDGLWSVLIEEWTSPYGILFIVGIGVTLGVLLGALLLICVVMLSKRYRDVCRCFQIDPDSAKLSQHNHQTLMTPQQPITDKHTDHMVMDYAGTHAWLSQRPLPDPEQEADLVALCDEERREVAVDAYSSQTSQAFLDSLQPVQYAVYPPGAMHGTMSSAYGPSPGGTVQTCYIAGNPHLYESPGCSDRTDLV